MNKAWEPTFDDWAEDKVSLSSCELSTHSTSRNEYGVMMQVADAEESCPEGAAIFWTDEMHLYLRYDWGQWYKVSNDDPDNCSNICKRNSAKLLLCTATSIRHYAVRVYKIDKLPEELFGRQTDDAPNSDKATQLDLGFEDPPPVVNLDGEEAALSPSPDIPDIFANDSDEEKAIEKEVEAFLERTSSIDEKIQEAVDAEIEKHGGRVYSRYRPGNNRLYSYDFARIGKRYFIVVYADFAGYWLADEESFTPEPPLWFSQDDHRTSPIYQAQKCCSFFQRELPQIKVESMVVLPKECVVINDDDMRDCWNKKCNTAVVRTKIIDETTLETLHEHLASQPVGDREVPELDTVEIVGISSRFAMTADWINKD